MTKKIPETSRHLRWGLAWYTLEMPHQPPSFLERSNEHRRQDLAIQRRILNGAKAYRARLAEAFADIRSRCKSGRHAGITDSQEGEKGQGIPKIKDEEGSMSGVADRDTGKDPAYHGGIPRITFRDQTEPGEPLPPQRDQGQPQGVASDVPALERPHSPTASSIQPAEGEIRNGQPSSHPAKICAKLQGQDPSSPVSFFVHPLEYAIFFSTHKAMCNSKNLRESNQ
jgi:hypothetical protein